MTTPTPEQQAENLVQAYERVFGPITDAEHRAGLREALKRRLAEAAESDAPTLLGLPVTFIDDERSRDGGYRE